MACLEPGRAVESGRFILPVRLDEAALAVEDIVPKLVNSTRGVGDCASVAAIADKFESCAFERTIVPSIPDVDSPIMPLEGSHTTQAVLDSWLAKGTLLGADGVHCVFVAFMDVMRRPFQGSWTVQTITVIGTKQSVASLLDEMAVESEPAEESETPRTEALAVRASPPPERREDLPTQASQETPIRSPRDPASEYYSPDRAALWRLRMNL